MKNTTIILMLIAVLTFVAAPAVADWDETMPAKWVQLPDLSPEGIDIYNMENTAGIRKVLADDFKCTSPIPITDVHFWGSWKYDEEGIITNVHLSFHTDIPASPDGTWPEYSRPGTLLWERDFGQAEFTIAGPIRSPDEDWYNPNTGEYLRDNHQNAWQINIVDIQDPFEQRGTLDEPIVYWLDIVVKAEGGEWGWKTSMDHWNDDAVWSDWFPNGDNGDPVNELSLNQWNELRYPDGHPFHPESIDLAFVITPEPGTMSLLVLGGIAMLLRRRRK